MPNTIRDKKIPPPLPEVDFSWNPTAFYEGFTLAGNNYPPPGDTVVGVPSTDEITFTAEIGELEPGDQIIEYFWRFGDGNTGYGPVISHTYAIDFPEARVVLCVTDNRGRRTCTGKQINLSASEDVLLVI